MALVCPRCHQPLRYQRVGVHLGPSKAVMFDLLLRAGDIGLTADELIQGLAAAGMAARTYNTIKSHIYQLRELLVETDYRIALDRPPLDEVRRGAPARKDKDRCRWFLTKRNGSVTGEAAE